MAALNVISKLVPALSTIITEVVQQRMRDMKQITNIKKHDKTEQSLQTIEHMLVRLENKISENRKTIEEFRIKFFLSGLLNLVLLVIILLRVFNIM